jgi:hypothetical protein
MIGKVEKAYMQAIADAIRAQNKSNDTYTPSEMADAIEDLVIGGGGTLISKTVTEEGTYIAENDGADGYSEVINNIPWYIVPYAYDLNPNGYVMNNKWQVNGATVNYSDVYKVKAGHKYMLALGDRTGSRWRGMFSSEDTTTATKEIAAYSMPINATNPSARRADTITAPIDGYFTITKDNAGKANIKTYLFDITIT